MLMVIILFLLSKTQNYMFDSILYILSTSNSTNRIVGQWKKLDDDGNTIDEGNDQSMFILTVSEKIKETRLKFSQGSIIVLKIMGNYQTTRVKLTNTQLNKLNSAGKNKTGTILSLNKKNFQDEELPYEFFPTTR